MAISILANGNKNFNLDNNTKLQSSTISIKNIKSPNPSSLVGDFEEISLSNQFSRDSITDSLRDSLSTTVSSPIYFSDASSTRSSGDSSNEDDVDISTANTSAASAASASTNSSSSSTTNSRDSSTDDVTITSPTHKLPRRLPSATDVKSFTNYRSPNQSSSSSSSSYAPSPASATKQSLPNATQTSSTMPGNRPLADDYSFVHKRLARQRSIGGGLHRSNQTHTRIQGKNDLNPSVSTDIIPRRASTGTTTTTPSTSTSRMPSRMANPAPSSRRSTPLLRKALSSSHLSQTGLGIYPATTTDSQFSISSPSHSHSHTPQIRPKLRPHRSTSRLSVNQLELEYDHQEGIDYDLPDDALMWNVPLSPALYAKSRQSSLDVSSASIGTGVSHSIEPLNTGTPPTRKHRSSAYNSPDVSTLPSIQESEPVLYTSGLENLGKDAQDLTIALTQSPNCHDIDRRASAGSSRTSISSSGQSSRRQSLRRVSSTSSFTENSFSSDLSHYSLTSKTRPTGLPPKALDEEQKHLKEFSKILEKAALADKKRQSKRESELRTRDKQRQKDELEWQKIIPNLSTINQKSSSIRDLWWRGIPSKYREQVWKQQIGNKLQLTSDDYSNCLSQASRTLTPQLHQRIAADTRSTFTEFQIFGENGPLHNDLVNIIKAYAIYRPKIGYKPGITSMTAILLLNMSTPLDAFIALANMLEGSLTQALLTGDDRTVTSYYSSFLKVLNTKLPTLYQHFQNIQLPPSAYLEPMLSSQFSNHLSIDIVHRVWDVLVFEGDAFLLRVALGVILSIEHRLYGTPSEILNEVGWNAQSLIDVSDEDCFMQTVRSSLKA